MTWNARHRWVRGLSIAVLALVLVSVGIAVTTGPVLAADTGPTVAATGDQVGANAGPAVEVTGGEVEPGENVTVTVSASNTAVLSLDGIPSEWEIVDYEAAGGTPQVGTTDGTQKIIWAWSEDGERNVNVTLAVPATASAGSTDLVATAFNSDDAEASASGTVDVNTSTEPSLAELVDSDEDGEIGNLEILGAIEDWRNNESISGTDRQISDSEILNLIEMWRTNATV